MRERAAETHFITRNSFDICRRFCHRIRSDTQRGTFQCVGRLPPRPRVRRNGDGGKEPFRLGIEQAEHLPSEHLVSEGRPLQVRKVDRPR